MLAKYINMCVLEYINFNVLKYIKYNYMHILNIVFCKIRINVFTYKFIKYVKVYEILCETY